MGNTGAFDRAQTHDWLVSTFNKSNALPTGPLCPLLVSLSFFCHTSAFRLYTFFLQAGDIIGRFFKIIVIISIFCFFRSLWWLPFMFWWPWPFTMSFTWWPMTFAWWPLVCVRSWPVGGGGWGRGPDWGGMTFLHRCPHSLEWYNIR